MKGDRTYYERKFLRRRRYKLGRSRVARERLETLLDLIRPVPVGNRMIRVGNAEDGGYMCLDHFESCESVVSCGIADDVSFDLCFAERGIPVFQYDDSVDGPPVEHEQFHFKRHRVEGVDRPTDDVYSLDTIIRGNCHGISSAVLKLDIESSEWAALASVTPRLLRQHVSALYIEFHELCELLNDAFYDRALGVFTTLAEDYVPVSLHPNNNGELVVFGNRAFPSVFEVSFIRRDLVESIGGAEERALAVLPNNPNLPDVYLGDLIG